MKLLGKIFIKGEIETLTGLHIGGSSSALDIGGIDNNVIKKADGVPYIPGSSLKGKMRSLIEMMHSDYTQETGNVDNGKKDKPKDWPDGQPIPDGDPKIQKIFGTVAEKKDMKTRLIVRDVYLDDEVKVTMDNKKGEFENLELDYTEAKYENTIDRLTSKANPRQMERVPPGAKFNFSMVFNIYDEADIDLLPMVFKSLRLVKDDYLGGSGSRGSGQVDFKNLALSYKNLQKYEGGEGAHSINLDEDIINISPSNINELKKAFNSGQVNADAH